jgi:hypothetical protein
VELGRRPDAGRPAPQGQSTLSEYFVQIGRKAAHIKIMSARTLTTSSAT